MRGERPGPEHPGQAVFDPICFAPGALELHPGRQADPASAAISDEGVLAGLPACPRCIACGVSAILQRLPAQNARQAVPHQVRGAGGQARPLCILAGFWISLILMIGR